MVEITICPFCMTIFLYQNFSGEECPSCHIGILENIDEYYERVKGIDQDGQRENNSGVTS